MYSEYLDSEILTAEPVKLVQLMYRGAIDAIAEARRALAAGDIPGRSRLISKASAILNELALSLDHSQDAELCRNLVELYDYMLRRLIEANTNQIEAPLVEVENLLSGLLTAWQQAGQSEQPERTSYGQSSSYVSASTEYQSVSYAY